MKVLHHRKTVDVVCFLPVRGVTVSLGRRRLCILLLDLRNVKASCTMPKALTSFALSTKGRKEGDGVATSMVEAAGFTVIIMFELPFW